MGVRVIRDSDQDMSALHCSTSGFAFGEVFYGTDKAGEFLHWFVEQYPSSDPRDLGDQALADRVAYWRRTLDAKERASV